MRIYFKIIFFILQSFFINGQIWVGVGIMYDPITKFDGDDYTYDYKPIGNEFVGGSINYFTRLNIVPRIGYKFISYSYQNYVNTFTVPDKIWDLPGFEKLEYPFLNRNLYWQKHNISIHRTFYNKLVTLLSCSYIRLRDEQEYLYLIEDKVHWGQSNKHSIGLGLGIQFGVEVIHNLDIVGGLSRFWLKNKDINNGYAFTFGLQYRMNLWDF